MALTWTDRLAGAALVLVWMIFCLFVCWAWMRSRCPRRGRVTEPRSHVELKDARPYDWEKDE